MWGESPQAAIQTDTGSFFFYLFNDFLSLSVSSLNWGSKNWGCHIPSRLSSPWSKLVILLYKLNWPDFTLENCKSGYQDWVTVNNICFCLRTSCLTLSINAPQNSFWEEVILSVQITTSASKKCQVVSLVCYQCVAALVMELHFQMKFRNQTSNSALWCFL